MEGTPRNSSQFVESRRCGYDVMTRGSARGDFHVGLLYIYIYIYNIELVPLLGVRQPVQPVQVESQP